MKKRILHKDDVVYQKLDNFSNDMCIRCEKPFKYTDVRYISDYNSVCLDCWPQFKLESKLNIILDEIPQQH